MKLIIFDIDRTLCHSKIDNLSFINAFKKALNIEIKNRDWDSYPHVTDYAITEQIISDSLGFAATDEHFRKIIDSYVEELDIHSTRDPDSFTIIPGAKELLKTLEENNGFKAGVATGGFSKSANYKLSKLGFDFTNIKVFGSDNYRSKHEIISALIKAEETGSAFEKIVYVGDREYDYTTAKDLGIDFLGVDYDRNDRLNNLGVKNVINDFLPVEKVVRLLE